MKEIEAIGKIIADYSKEGKNMDVTRLLELQDRLVGAGYWLANYVSDLKTEYNENYFIRKIAVSKRTQGLIASGKSAAASAAEATTEFEEFFKNEIESESNTFRADLLLKQLNKVLSAIQQRISYAKQIEDYTK